MATDSAGVSDPGYNGSLLTDHRLVRRNVGVGGSLGNQGHPYLTAEDAESAEALASPVA